MSKKQRRNVSQGPRRPATEIKQPSGSSPAAASPGGTPQAYSSSGSTGSMAGQRRFTGVAEFKPDYSHVVSDLKRIGILAGSFFVILVVLSFILK
jgi:hypothetical protein